MVSCILLMVKRNVKRFPTNFLLEVSTRDWKFRFQIVILKKMIMLWACKMQLQKKETRHKKIE